MNICIGIMNTRGLFTLIRSKASSMVCRYLSLGFVGPLGRTDVTKEKWIMGTPLMKRRKSVKYTLDIIENKLLGKDNKYICNNKLSIADLLCYSEITQIETWNLLDNGSKLGFGNDGSKYLQSNYPNIFQWIQRMKQVPFHDEVCKDMVTPNMLQFIQYRKKSFDDNLNKYLSKL